jgi:hypothetical protein
MATSQYARRRDERATLYVQDVTEAERKAREAKTARLRESRLAWEAANPPEKAKPTVAKNKPKKR